MICYSTKQSSEEQNAICKVLFARMPPGSASRRWLAAPGAPAGLVLTRPASVAWATGGVAPPVDRSADTDLVWAVITPAGAGLITTEVEAGRIAEEYQPALHGFTELATVPWYRPEEFVRAAEELAGAPAARLAGDGHPAFAGDASGDLIEARLALSGPEQEELRDLGGDAAAALEDALAVLVPRRARPGCAGAGGGLTRRMRRGRAGPDRRRRRPGAPLPPPDGGRCASARTGHGGGGGAPGRPARRRHPVRLRGPAAAGPARAAGPGGPDRAGRAGGEPAGGSYGQALSALDAGYAREGAAGGWAGHYQGGPIGFAQREFEIAPCQHDSRWYSTRIEAGHAVAWNPSLPGGAKAEDTYLVQSGRDGARHHRPGGPAGPAWPVEDGDDVVPPRPAVLEV